MNLETSTKVPVSEIYGPVTQGEGPYIGAWTFFLRLAGCDFKCHFCDSMFAVDPKHPDWQMTLMTPKDIMEKLHHESEKWGIKRVTLSGGNPAMFKKMEDVVRLLNADGWDIHIETQGTIWNDWLKWVNSLVISPKAPGMGAPFIEDVYRKFVKLAMIAADASGGSLDIGIKIACFSKNDVKFAFDVFDITDQERVKGVQPKYYISVGNEYVDDALPPGQSIRDYLTERFMQTCDDVQEVQSELYKGNKTSLADRAVGNSARVLPQLHAIAWGNERAR